MKRKLNNRQVTYLGVLIGLLISGGIAGLWSAVRHINDEEIRAEAAKDSARQERQEQLAVEIAQEQALQDSIVTYKNTHSSAVIAQRMQVILSEELRHAGTRPYYDKYRTDDFKEDLQAVIDFDKEPRDEKPQMTFRDMPFYQSIPAKMIRDLMIKRIYYVTEESARVDVRYLVKRVEKIEDGERERDTTYYEPKTATYKLALKDDEWLVEDRIVDFLSERAAFRRYMDGEYFADPIEEELTDSLLTDSIVKREEHPTKKETTKNEVKKKEEAKPKNEVKKKEEAKPKNEVKKKEEVKPKNEVKKKEEAKPKNEVKKKEEAKKKNDVKKKEEAKPKNEVKKKEEAKPKNEMKKKEEAKPKPEKKSTSNTKK